MQRTVRTHITIFGALLTGALFATPSLAADDPGIYVRQTIGLAGWPTGAISDTRVQMRTPLTRQEGSLVFNSTYAGAGVAARVSPAVAEVGPSLSIQPIDVFDLNLQASRVQYYSTRFGLMPFESPDGKIMSARLERAAEGDGVTSGGWTFAANPTVKLKLGPVIAFSSWTVAYTTLDQPEDVTAPYTYEPLRDMVVAWTDTTVDHEAGALYAAVDSDDGGKIVYFGVLARDRFQVVSPDRHTTLGPLLVVKPGEGTGVPRMVARSMFYLTEADRVGRMPNIQLAAIWEVGK